MPACWSYIVCHTIYVALNCCHPKIISQKGISIQFYSLQQDCAIVFHRGCCPETLTLCLCALQIRLSSSLFLVDLHISETDFCLFLSLCILNLDFMAMSLYHRLTLNFRILFFRQFLKMDKKANSIYEQSKILNCWYIIKSIHSISNISIHRERSYTLYTSDFQCNSRSEI